MINLKCYLKRILALAVVIFAVYACIYVPTDTDLSLGGAAVPVDSFCVKELRHRHGMERGLSRQETRKLYHVLLEDIQHHIDELNSSYSEAQRAVACSHMRSRARLYSRSRDGTYKIPIVTAVLQLRDSYIHGLRYLPRALWKDVIRSIASVAPTLEHTRLVLRGSIDCLLPARRPNARRTHFSGASEEKTTPPFFSRALRATPIITASIPNRPSTPRAVMQTCDGA